MAGRRTNLALLVLLLTALGTGGLMFGLGSGWNRWATAAHGVVGLAIVALTPWKSTISRRGLRRRGRAEALPSLLLAGMVVVALLSGLAYRLGVREMGPVDSIQVHVAAGAIAAPLVLWHVGSRPVRPRRADLSRRAVLRAGGLAAVAGVAWIVLPAARRRFTGSLERGSFDPDAMPVTQWFNDTVPDIDPAAYRLLVGETEHDVDALRRYGDEVEATLDCTGGWYAVQRWRGVRLDRLVGGLPGQTIVVRSRTGFTRRFSRADAVNLYVATDIADRPLSPGHGAPARLVAPGRRGFWWVKWLDRIDLDDRPWWVDSPFPLT